MNALDNTPILIDLDNPPSIPENLDKIEDTIAGTKIDDPHVYSKIGVLKFAQEKPKSLPYFEKAMELAKEISNPQAIAECLLNLALFYLTPGTLDFSLEYSKSALNIFIDLGDRHYEALVYQILGEIYIDIEFDDDDLDIALQYYDQAKQLHETLGDINGLAKDLHGIGQVYHQKYNLELAREYLQKAKLIYRDINNKSGEASCILAISFTYYRKDNEERCLKAYTDARKLYQEANDLYGEANCLCHLAIYLSNDPPAALLKYQEAYNIYEEIGALGDKNSISYNMKLIQRKIGDLKKANKNHSCTE